MKYLSNCTGLKFSHSIKINISIMAGLEPATSRFGVGRPILLGHMILEFTQLGAFACYVTIRIMK